MHKGRRTISEFVDDLQSHGRYTFTLAELRTMGQRSELSNTMALQRLKKQRRVVSPRRGFYVIVPIEYKSTGSPPPSWFIDDLMKFLKQPYYVGILSAAAHHGAAHQQPMVFQVVTDRATRDSKSTGIRIEFHVTNHLGAIAIERVQTETGTMKVSSPEATAFDVVRYFKAAGHMNNVATVLVELSEKLRPAELLKVAMSYSLSEVQRLGYILNYIGKQEHAAPLQRWLSDQAIRPTPLVVGRPREKCKVDASWKVIVNETLEPDV